MEPDSPMSSSDPCAHDDDQDHGHAAARAGRQVDHQMDRVRAVRRVFWITLGLNAVVAISKASYGYITGSVALGTDSVHSILDGASNVLALFGLHWSTAPANARHPYGHRKIEILAALGIGVLIVISLFELAEAAVASLRGHRPPPQIGWPAYAVVIGTMVINFFVTRYEHGKGHELSSHLLCADAEHTKSDLYASGAVLLSFLAIRNGMPWADGVGGLVLVGLVGRAAWMVFRENVPVLLDAAILDPAGIIDLAGQRRRRRERPSRPVARNAQRGRAGLAHAGRPRDQRDRCPPPGEPDRKRPEAKVSPAIRRGNPHRTDSPYQPYLSPAGQRSTESE